MIDQGALSQVGLSIDFNTTGIEIYTGRCVLCGYDLANRHASAFRYLKIYDIAEAPDESDTPKMVLARPYGSACNVEYNRPIEFVNGIWVRGTTGLAHNDTGAPTAGDLVGQILYKPNE